MPFINIDERSFDFSGYDEINEKWDKFVDFTNNLVLLHSNSVSLNKWTRHGISYAGDVPFKLLVDPCHCCLKNTQSLI